MNSYPYESPPEQPSEKTAETEPGYFGSLVYLALHVLFVLAIAIPAVQTSIEDVRRFAGDPRMQLQLGPRATIAYLHCKYGPMVIVSPWIGKWAHRRLLKSMLSVVWVLPTANAISALVMLFSVTAISYLRSISVDFSTLPLMYFTLLFPLHFVAISIVFLQVSIYSALFWYHVKRSGTIHGRQS